MLKFSPGKYFSKSAKIFAAQVFASFLIAYMYNGSLHFVSFYLATADWLTHEIYPPQKCHRIQYIRRSWDYVVLWAVLTLLFTILFKRCTTFEGSLKQFCTNGEFSVGFCKAGRKVLCHSLTWNPNFCRRFNWKLGKMRMVQDTLMEEEGSLKLCLLDCWNCCVVSQGHAVSGKFC